MCLLCVKKLSWNSSLHAVKKGEGYFHILEMQKRPLCNSTVTQNDDDDSKVFEIQIDYRLNLSVYYREYWVNEGVIMDTARDVLLLQCSKQL